MQPAIFRKVQAAVVQAAPVLFDTPRTLQKLADLTADAAQRGADLVVFPEAFVGGYPKGYDFGVSLGIRSPEGRDAFRRYFENAIEVPGSVTDFLGSPSSRCWPPSRSPSRGLGLVSSPSRRSIRTIYS